MDNSSSYRGQRMELSDGQWIYKETKRPVSEEHLNTPCGVCNEPYTKEGHDPCLGTLPGVKNACCGHGDSQPYVQFLDGKDLRGQDAFDWINQVGRSLPCQ